MNTLVTQLQPPAHFNAAYAERAYRRNYRTVMVRFWRENSSAPWRATMLDPGGEPPQHFASVSELFANLWDTLNNTEQI